MEETIIAFLFHLRAHGAAQTTMIYYRSRLARAARHLRCSIEEINQVRLTDYAAWLHLRFRPNLVDGHLLALNRFLDWCVEEGILIENPALMSSRVSREGNGRPLPIPRNRSV